MPIAVITICVRVSKQFVGYDEDENRQRQQREYLLFAVHRMFALSLRRSMSWCADIQSHCTVCRKACRGIAGDIGTDPLPRFGSRLRRATQPGLAFREAATAQITGVPCPSN